jgi:Zn-dependent M28 family amino/carboxypeptidase
LTLAESLTRQRPQHDVLLVWFDAEEGGMVGSRAFVEAPPVAVGRIAANLNLDMVGRHDAGALWVAGAAHTPLLAPIARAAAEGASVAVRLGHDTPSATPSDDWTLSSDHASFHRAGIPFLYLGVEDHADYHGAGDDAEKIRAAFFGGTTSYAIAVMRAMDAALPQLHAARVTPPAR